ncbi:MAG TPA: exonuclease SbcCD subunit D [Verrucomicrobiae bacterium]|nr:exonuclease SbcCD subunit D [Verrucomicrobiae bacterium]
MPIKLMHLADIHLGMENYGRIDPKTGLNSRLVDFLNSFDQAVNYAIDNSVDLVIFAGDAFKHRDPNPTQQREFAARIKRLSRAGIPTVLLVGNHDMPNSEGKAHSLEIYRTLAVDNVHVARRPEILNLETKSGPVQVACLPYLTRSALLSKEDFKGLSLEGLDNKIVELLDLFIAKMAKDMDPNIPSVLTAHVSVANAVLGSEKSIMVGKDIVLPLSSVARPEFDYVALGHIHRHQVLCDHPPVVYAGSLDRVDFGEEKEPKGFCIVDLAKGATGMKFHRVANRPFLTLEFAPHNPDPTPEILTGFAAEDLSETVVRVKLKLTQEQAGVMRLDEIHRSLSREAYFLAGIHKEISGPVAGVRSPGLTEKVGPVEALAVYLEGQPDLAEQVPRLVELATGLMLELREEDVS